jgi:general secretion pathway protein B
MSFILDALKKSEIERQRQSVPGLIDVPPAAKRRRLPWWAVSLGVLLLVNVGVLTFLLVRGGTRTAALAAAAAPTHAAPGEAAPATGTQPAEAPAAGAVARQDDHHFSPLDNAPQYAPEIPVQNDTPAPLTGTAAAPAEAPRSTRHVDPVLSENESPADNDEVLPSVNELNLSGQQALPELHLDVHVFGTRPSERFGYINMRTYHEGATLQEGPVLEHIRRDGAVLNFHGVRFLLPRQP